MWIAGYGPKVLDMAGRVGDGVILQFADPDLIEWCLGFVKKGAEAAGRDYKKIEVMAAAPVWISDDLEHARKQVRWFPALVSNHVVDLLSRYKPEELPPALTSYVSNRGGYDYQQHCEVDSSNSKFVSDDVVDRFCVVGTGGGASRKVAAAGEAGGDAVQCVSDVRGGRGDAGGVQERNLAPILVRAFCAARTKVHLRAAIPLDLYLVRLTWTKLGTGVKTHDIVTWAEIAKHIPTVGIGR